MWATSRPIIQLTPPGKRTSTSNGRGFGASSPNWLISPRSSPRAVRVRPRASTPRCALDLAAGALPVSRLTRPDLLYDLLEDLLEDLLGDLPGFVISGLAAAVAVAPIACGGMLRAR